MINIKRMKPNEKAIQLIDSFGQGTRNRWDSKSMSVTRATLCALICVDEILKEVPKFVGILQLNDNWTYWESVKQEINKL